MLRSHFTAALLGGLTVAVLSGGVAVAHGMINSGDIVDGSIRSIDIGTGKVKSSDILDGTVESVDVGDDSVTSDDLASGSVGELEIVDDAVTASALGTITTRSAASTPIAPGGNGAVTANCLAGEQVLSGGNDGFVDLLVVASRKEGNGWLVYAHNEGAASRVITAHAYCLAP
jgi:hypothetical protein